MSFDQLWNSFDRVKEYWLENKQIVESFLELMRFKNEVERTYIKGIEKLLTFPFFKLAKNSLVSAADKIKSFYTKNMNLITNIADSTDSLIILPLKEILQDHDFVFKDRTDHYRVLQKRQKKITKSISLSKEKYWKSCKDTLLSQKNKAELAAKEAQHLEAYIKDIDEMNRFSLSFIEEIGKNLSSLQVLEAERFTVLQDSFNKIHEIYEKGAKYLMAEVDTLPSAIESFQPAKDIIQFIDETGKSAPLKLSFVEECPYGFTCKVPKQKSSEDDQFLLKIIIKCWDGLLVSQEEKLQFKALMSRQEMRKSWLYFMNDRRIKGQFSVHPEGFQVMEELLNMFLDTISSLSDTHSAKMTIIMSQTFYKSVNQEKHYLHVAIASHLIWQHKEIWISMIEEGIEQEMKNYQEFCSDESNEEHKSSLVVSQLSSYIHIMKSFGIASELIQSVGEGLSGKYKTQVNVSDFLGN